MMPRRPSAWLLSAGLLGCVRPEPPPADTGETSLPDPADSATAVESADPEETAQPRPAWGPATLTLGPPVTCDDPEAAASLGRYVRATFSAPEGGHAYLEGANAAIADLDDDGLLDVVAVSEQGVWAWFQQGGVPISETPVTRLWTQTDDDPVAGLFSVLPVDLDEDGDLDLAVSGRGVPSAWLFQEAPRTFRAGVPEGIALPQGHHTAAISAADVDGDLDLDLFIAGHGFVDESAESPELLGPADPSYLFLREADGWVDASDRLPDSVQAAFTFLGGWFDLDGDGDLDLYSINDFGGAQQPCRVARNEGGRFVADDNALGLDAPFAGMGLGIGDVDGDAREDLAVVAWDGQRLFRNTAGGWFETSAAAKFDTAPPQTVGWSPQVFDVENDGDADIGVNYGFLDTKFGANNGRAQPDGMFVQASNGTFSEMAASGRTDDVGPSRGLAVGDLDGDGVLDLVKSQADGTVVFHISRCTAASWVGFDLRQAAPNPRAVGAEVRLYAAGRVWVQTVRVGGTGYGSGMPLRLHVGLGDVEQLDRVEVRWPDGVTDRFEDVPVRAVHQIARARVP
jgi:hypothetical protein